MKIKSYMLYILGAFIGFLAFAFSMNYVKSNSILIIVGMVSMSGMMYCTSKLFNSYLMKQEKK